MEDFIEMEVSEVQSEEVRDYFILTVSVDQAGDPSIYRTEGIAIT